MEHLFGDLPALTNSNNITEICTDNSWRKIKYETKLGKGTMLLAAQGANPEPVELKLNLSGWHKIYISVIKMRCDSYTYIKLSDDSWYTGIKPSRAVPPAKWCVSEYIEEIYWKSADLTNQNIIIAKPKATFYEFTSGLVWIRCVSMSENEIQQYSAHSEKNKCVQMHFDEDLYVDEIYENEDAYLMKPSIMKNSNVDFCSYEYSFDIDRCEKSTDLSINNTDAIWRKGDYEFEKIRNKYIEKLILFSKENNISLYAANRMSVSNFSTPFNRENWNKNFVNNHPEFYCVNRDKSIVNVCSYAYDDVQQYVIDGMKEMIKHGFNGISMIYTRGMHIGFEKPVIDRFKQQHPGVDPHLLPVSDERLHNIWCQFMTEFMRKVRKELDNISDHHIPINVITYSLENSKNFGLDIETWAKEKLIDSASRSNIKTVEDLTDCMGDENLSIIDMEKYKKRILDYPPLYRTDPEDICKDIKKYNMLEEKYGVTVYHDLPWVNSLSVEEYENFVKLIKSNGAEKFLSWNTNHIATNLPEWHIVSSIGNHRDTDIVLRKHYRVLSLDNSCISHFNPNWRG